MSQPEPTSVHPPRIKPAAEPEPDSETSTHARVPAKETAVTGGSPSADSAKVSAALDPTVDCAKSAAPNVSELRTLGPYQLLELLGEGGMGAVYKARHTRLNKLVAVKVLPTHLTRDVDALARFDREMKAVGSLEHPGIVRAMDAGEANGTHYLAMEFVEGQDAQMYVITHGPLAINMACRIVRQAALALSYAHEHGMVHRDIKPSNLFLTRTGQVKVLDLGLARLAQDEQQQPLTSAGQCMGTPDYMAPEQWEDTHTVDHRCDLYALGCTLFHFLVGRAPYADEQHRSMASKMKAHLLQPIPDVRASRADVPEDLAMIYMSLMAKDPADRLANAKLLAEQLTPFCKAETSGFLSTGTSGESKRTEPIAGPVPVETHESEATNTASTASAQLPPRRHSRTAIAAASGAAALVLLATIIITITNKDDTNTIVRLPEGVETDAQAAPGSKVTITETEDPAPATLKPAVAESLAAVASPASAPIDYAAERKAAEWALSVGAGLELMTPSDGIKSVVGENGKLPNEPFALKEMAVYSRSEVTDDKLSRLKECRRLESLVLFGTPVTGLGLSHLVDVRTLTDLDLSTNALSDTGLAKVAAFTQLRALNLTSNRDLTDAALPHLRLLTKLETLWLNDLNISDAGVRSLSELHQLRRLHLATDHRLTDVGVTQLIQQNEELEVLSIVDDSGGRTLAPLAQAPRLQTLLISGNQMTPAGLTVLKALKEFRSLEIWTPLKTEELVRVSELPRLRRVMLRFVHGDGFNPDDEAYAALARLPMLEEIDISGTQLSPSDTVLEKWAAIPSLKSVFMQHEEPNRRYTAEGLEKFHNARSDVQLNVDGNEYPKK